MKMSKKPVLLCIMDGFGKNESGYGNAIIAAKTPNLDKIMDSNPMTYIGASGMDVGLPDGQMGNSEVGHTNIGAGRVVYQELTRITKSISDGDFFGNEALAGAMDHCLKNGSALHLMGLLSDGGVHSHNTHLYGLLELAKRKGIKDVFVHCFMDGRDVPPTSGKDFVVELYNKCNEILARCGGHVSAVHKAMNKHLFNAHILRHSHDAVKMSVMAVNAAV